MYCPKCGLQQVSDNMRFCSRCGLPISGLAEWLAGGATLVAPEESPVKIPSLRRKGIRRGAKLIFFSAVLTPVFFGLSIIFDSAIPLFAPLTVFLLGLSFMLYTRLFGEDIPLIGSRQAQPSRLGPTTDNNALPPASDIGISGIGRPVRTAEIAQPPSVTEHTTKLLDSE
jgi:hypothetical protein